MSTVQLPGSNRFDSQMQMQTGNQKYGVSLAKEFQHHLTKDHHKNSVFDNKKWTYIQHHVQNNTDVAQQYVKIYCNTNQFP